jgi:hypothetical protein
LQLVGHAVDGDDGVFAPTILSRTHGDYVPVSLEALPQRANRARLPSTSDRSRSFNVERYRSVLLQSRRRTGPV